LAPFYARRRKVVRSLPGFWPTALRGCDELADYISYEDDELLDHLIDLHVTYLDDDAATTDSQSRKIVSRVRFEFEFEENDFLAENQIEKTFALVSFPVESDGNDDEASGNKKPTQTKYTSTPTKLVWKKHKNLTKGKYGASTNSFFNWFRYTGDGPGDYSGGDEVALTISEVVFPEAEKLYIAGMGKDGDDDEDDELEDEYDLGSDDEPEPPKKKAKNNE
jgi:template-activating factor I